MIILPPHKLRFDWRSNVSALRWLILLYGRPERVQSFMSMYKGLRLIRAEVLLFTHFLLLIALIIVPARLIFYFWVVRACRSLGIVSNCSIKVIAHSGLSGSCSGMFAASTKRRTSSTEARLAFAVLTRERNAA